MPAAYSLDLRERVWRACEQAQDTRVEIAARFAVSVSFVRDVRRRVRESGSAAAKAHGGGAARKADARQDQLLAGLVAARGDDTLVEHATSLAALPDGEYLSEATICRALQRLRLTQKKENPLSRRAGKRAGAGPARRLPSRDRRAR